MMYAGDISENSSLLYYVDDLEKEPVEYYNFVWPSNYFKFVYKATEFTKDKGSERLGAPSESYSINGILFNIVLLLAFLPLFLVILHAIAYPIVIQAHLLDYYIEGMREAFSKIYVPYGATPMRMMVFSIVMFFSLLFVPSSESKKDFLSSNIIALPVNIQPSNTIVGLPVDSYRIIIESKDHVDTDTGFRTVIFEFKDGFELPVYISYQYDSKIYSDFETLSRSYINKKQLMEVEILDDLSIHPVLINEPIDEVGTQTFRE